jgi:hypothetical protein
MPQKAIVPLWGMVGRRRGVIFTLRKPVGVLWMEDLQAVERR